MSLEEIVVPGEAVSVSIRGIAEPVTVIVCRVLGLVLVSCAAASLLADCAHALLATGVRRSAAKAHASLLRSMMTLTHYLSEVSQPDLVCQVAKWHAVGRGR